jgi:uncharacterized protein YvpB
MLSGKIIINIAAVVLSSMLFGYFVVFFGEEIEKAWKLNNKKKKYLTSVFTIVIVTIFFKLVCSVVST